MHFADYASKVIETAADKPFATAQKVISDPFATKLQGAIRLPQAIYGYFCRFFPLFSAFGSKEPFRRLAHVAIFETKDVENGSKNENTFIMNVIRKNWIFHF
jgi:hypothetical protein